MRYDTRTSNEQALQNLRKAIEDGTLEKALTMASSFSTFSRKQKTVKDLSSVGMRASGLLITGVLIGASSALLPEALGYTYAQATLNTLNSACVFGSLGYLGLAMFNAVHGGLSTERIARKRIRTVLQRARNYLEIEEIKKQGVIDVESRVM